MASTTITPTAASHSERPAVAFVQVKGAYVPDRVVMPAGRPLRLVFRREETAPCSESVIFPDFGTSVMLPPDRDVTVELPPCPPGRHEFTCRMGVLRGLLVVVP